MTNEKKELEQIKVAIGCVVRNRAWILPEYLQAIENIPFDNKEYIFLENNSTDETFAILESFVHLQSALTKKVWMGKTDRPSAPGYRRNEYHVNGYEYLASLRNLFLLMFYITKADYLLSIDSDIIVPPNILEELLVLADTKTIVAAAISNIPEKSLDGFIPGNFMITSSDGVLIHPPAYPLQGEMEVDVTGAVCLIPRSAIKDGARYGMHPQGEDIPFCLQAKQAGYKMMVTFDVQCDHRMLEENSS